MKIRISKRQWEEMGKVAGWKFGEPGFGRFSRELTNVLEHLISPHRNESPVKIAHMLKRTHGILYLMREEAMTDPELMQLIENVLEKSNAV